MRFFVPDEVHEHLLRRGFVRNYWYWTAHGEYEPNELNDVGASGTSGHGSFCMDHEHNNYESMVFDAMGQNAYDQSARNNEKMNSNVEEPPNKDTQYFYDVLNSAWWELWPECESHFELSMAVQMMSLKSEHNMSQGCFNRMAQLLKNSNPSGNCVPESFYEAKKLIKRLGLTSIKYDCCINGCMLYYKDDAELTMCKFCGHNRFKVSANNKLVPYKRSHYLPLTPRLKRLYASMQSTEHMRWHSESNRQPGVLIHPSDGLA